MKILLILEAGIPAYRKFLFEALSLEYNGQFSVIHTGKIYYDDGSGNFEKIKVPFLGNTKLGMHIGLKKYIKQYDIIITSYNLRIITCWLPMFFFKKPKWILWGKGLGGNDSKLVLYLRKITAKKAHKILVYNDYKKNEIINTLNISSSKVISVNNTINISNPGYSTNNELKYFLYFGRIQKRKGLSELIEQYQKYLEKCEFNSFFRLVFVGDGEYKLILEEKVKKMNLNNYIYFYRGEYDDIKIKKYFDHAIAYVSPFNVGLGIVNSLAYGVPIITTKTQQVGPEFHYLNEKNSFICDNINELADTLVYVSHMPQDLIKKECYDYYLKTLSSETMIQKFKDSINSLINER